MFAPVVFFLGISVSIAARSMRHALRKARERHAYRAGTSPARRAILFVLRLDRLARLGPVGIGPVAQLVEIAAHRQRLRAVHRDGTRAGLVAGLDALAHALGRNFAWRDGVEADAVSSPFRSQRHRHGMNG